MPESIQSLLMRIDTMDDPEEITKLVKIMKRIEENPNFRDDLDQIEIVKQCEAEEAQKKVQQ